MDTDTTTTVTLKTVKTPGKMLDTQQIANAIGRNWQYVNRQRHAGTFIDPSARLKNGTLLYTAGKVKQWAKAKGVAFNG